MRKNLYGSVAINTTNPKAHIPPKATKYLIFNLEIKMSMAKPISVTKAVPKSGSSIVKKNPKIA